MIIINIRTKKRDEIIEAEVLQMANDDSKWIKRQCLGVPPTYVCCLATGGSRAFATQAGGTRFEVFSQKNIQN